MSRCLDMKEPKRVCIWSITWNSYWLAFW